MRQFFTEQWLHEESLKPLSAAPQLISKSHPIIQIFFISFVAVSSVKFVYFGVAAGAAAASAAF